ncbi:MAG: hypothetical protein COB12_06695 [Flavobacterium sp.]|nr:MAG: hypothetical protein COB12_06695 [Flavobacterium sp.]
MRKYIYLLTFLLISSIGFAQDGNLFNPINSVAKIPQSPEVAAFEKFSGSVNMYSGVPTIGMPIYTLQGKEISVPISLSYDASGIKVDQIATNIGLGWNLNYGGVVTRNVNGLPDDYLSSGGVLSHPIYKTNTTQIWLAYLTDKGNIHGTHDTSSGANSARQTYDWYQKNGVDLQPDTFSFNVNGLSGTILIDYSSTPLNAYCLEDANLKVELEKDANESIINFTIKDTNGNLYTFGMAENTTHRTSPTDDLANEYIQTYTTAWYLTKIETPNNIDTFTFNYTADQWVDKQIVTELERFELLQYGCNGSFYFQSINNLGYNKYLKNQIRLTNINYNDKEVLKITTANNTRDDLENVKKIIKLEVFDRISPTSSNNPILIVDFDNTNYFTDGSSNPSFLDKRLKLDGIKIYRDDNTKAKEYEFDYYAGNIPDRLSNERDFWGYYNGESGNQNLAPSLNLDYSDIANYNSLFTSPPNASNAPTTNRKPNIFFSKIGTLKSIIFPTGGKSTYEYEEHKVKISSTLKKVGGLRIRKVINETLDPVTNENDILETYYLYDDLKKLVDDNVLTIPTAPFNMVNYSSGIAQQDLNFENFFEIDTDGSGCTNNKKYILNNNVSIIAPNNITYSKVTELRFNKNTTGSQFEGCTVTEFNNGLYDGGQGVAEEVAPYYNLNLDFGEIKSQRIYDNNLNLLQETSSDYKTDFLPISQLPFPEKVGLIMHKNNPSGTTGGSPGCKRYGETNGQWNYYFMFNTPQTSCPTNTSSVPDYSHYYNTPSYGYRQLWKKLVSTTTKTHENNQTLEQSTFYSYTSTFHNLATEIITKDSKGRNSKTEIIYPQDKSLLVNYPTASDNVLQDLIGRNQLTTPIEVTKYYQTPNLAAYSKTSQQRRFFDEFSTDKIYPSKVQVSKGIAPLEDRMIYHSYDEYGNLKEVAYPNGAHQIYIWGYKGEHLLAEIINSTYIGMPTPLEDTIAAIRTASDSEDSQGEENSLRTALNNLRNDTYFADSQITVYTYDPGIGVKSVTDVRGYTTYYYYDQHNRLDYATDQEGNVLSKNEYKLRIN